MRSERICPRTQGIYCWSKDLNLICFLVYSIVSQCIKPSALCNILGDVLHELGPMGLFASPNFFSFILLYVYIYIYVYLMREGGQFPKGANPTSQLTFAQKSYNRSFKLEPRAPFPFLQPSTMSKYASIPPVYRYK